MPRCTGGEGGWGEGGGEEEVKEGEGERRKEEEEVGGGRGRQRSIGRDGLRHLQHHKEWGLSSALRRDFQEGTDHKDRAIRMGRRKD